MLTKRRKSAAMRIDLISLAFVHLSATAVAFGQGAFQNLGFEMANVSNPDLLHSVPFSSAFPYWQAYGVHDVPSVPPGALTRAYYNATDMDQMTIGIYDAGGPANHPVFGRYTAYIEADLGSFRQGYIYLTQTGLIPADARSIRFVSASYSSLAGVSAQLSFSLNGTSISSIPLAIDPSYVLWGADVSAYAGSSAQIGFTVSALYPFADTTDPHVFVGVGLDSINFSTTPVPEPRAAALSMAGVLLLLLLPRAKCWRGSQRPRQPMPRSNSCAPRHRNDPCGRPTFPHGGYRRCDQG